MPPPKGLRPYLQFQKLPAPALGPVRRAVDEDDAFRQRVASVANEDFVDAAGLLWLRRPEGWEAELEQLAADEAAAQAEQDEERSEREARRRLEAAERVARASRAELASLRGDYEAERRHRHELEATLQKLERRTNQLEVELNGARRRLGQAEAEVAASTQARLDAEARQAELHAELARLTTTGPSAPPPVPGVPAAVADGGPAETGGVEAGTSAGAVLPSDHPPAGPTTPRVTDVPAPGVAEPAVAEPGSVLPGAAALASASAALQAAAEATSRLGAALAEAAAALAGPGAAADDLLAVRRPPPIAPPTPRRPPRARRVPVPLPGGVFADTVEAALFLVRVPGVLLVVDGYNAAKLGWPDEPLPIQRHRLLDALDELEARYGTDVLVVFDGAEVVSAAPGPRRSVRVVFSPSGVKADQVIVDEVANQPAYRPVVVATNDGEVRSGARGHGANLLTSQQLLAVARRG